MFKFRKKSHQEVLDKIPNHIGIIMDGNGRWAKKRLQPRVMGHKGWDGCFAKGNYRSVTTWSQGVDGLCLFNGKLVTPTR